MKRIFLKRISQLKANTEDQVFEHIKSFSVHNVQLSRLQPESSIVLLIWESIFLLKLLGLNNDGEEWNRGKTIDGLMEIQAGPGAFMF